MGKGKAALKPPTAAGRQTRPSPLLAWAKANPGATIAALLSIALVAVLSVWSPLGPEQFAKVGSWDWGDWS